MKWGRPSAAGAWALGLSAATWAAALLGLFVGGPIVVVAALGLGCGGVLRARRVAMVASLVLAGTISGTFAGARIEATRGASVPEGRITFVGRVAEDGTGDQPAVVVPTSRRVDGVWLDWAGPPLAVHSDDGLVAGEVARLQGSATAAPHRVRGDVVAGRVHATSVEHLGSEAGPLFWVGNAIRARVGRVLGEASVEQALLSGFLIGDVSRLPDSETDALRRSGLTHYVAVSGSNVALFLFGWWIVTAPFGIGPKRRAVLGVIGLSVFVVATRWEASVVRAAVMAGVVLLGAASGFALDAWVALGGTVILLLLISGHLAADVGFQLSAIATLGILVGAGMFHRRRPRWLWATLGAGISAQAAVVPVLLIHFGTVPILSPLANLAAAPLVTAATVVGAVGVLTGVGAVVGVASWFAGAVLAVARIAADWPQLGVGGVLALGAVGLAATRTGLRPLVALLAVAVVMISLLVRPGPPAVPTATFLDVGQGDAVLVRDPSGAVALVDGGRDPVLLRGGLRRYAVGRIDLLVVTHGDDDHVGGLAGIFDRTAVGRLWVPEHPDYGPALDALVDEADVLGIPVERIGAGVDTAVGELELGVLGPTRRYASQNDGSIVLLVTGGRSLLLGGDIEAVAQRELPILSPDVMLVPHHGSSTTDAAWLTRLAPEIAVVSVGENSYGHPAPEVLEVLRDVGAEIHVTRDDGDVSVPLR